LDVEVICERAPEALEIVDRPAPEGLIVVEPQSALRGKPIEVVADPGARASVLRRAPEHAGRRHVPHDARPIRGRYAAATMPPAAVPSTRGTARISRPAVVIVLAASQVALFGLGPVHAATTLPDEPGAVRIDGPSYAALVTDVDGDGVSELVRITNTGGDGTGLGVEIWRQAGDGSWDITGLAVPLRRGVINADYLMPATVGDSVRLLRWRQAGRDRVLAVVETG